MDRHIDRHGFARNAGVTIISVSQMGTPCGDCCPGYNPTVLPRRLRPIRLSRRAEPFDSDQFIFELKIDGFQALAHINAVNGELVS
jgi:hypothetical protein